MEDFEKLIINIVLIELKLSYLTNTHLYFIEKSLYDYAINSCRKYDKININKPFSITTVKKVYEKYTNNKINRLFISDLINMDFLDFCLKYNIKLKVSYKNRLRNPYKFYYRNVCYVLDNHPTIIKFDKDFKKLLTFTE